MRWVWSRLWSFQVQNPALRSLARPALALLGRRFAPQADIAERLAGSQDLMLFGTIDRMSDTREPLRRTFDRAADLYEAARPAYPDELFDDLVALAELERGARLLEIGCATGKATRPLLERGFSVVCVEMGVQLAENARGNLAGLPAEIHVAPFEEWEGEPEAFELVYAATAWHWINPAIRYRNAHRLLRPGGHLAFWSARHAFPSDFDRFFADIQEVYDAIGESHPGEWPPPSPGQIPSGARKRSWAKLEAVPCGPPPPNQPNSF